MYERTRVTAGKRFGMLPYSFSLAQLFYCWTGTVPHRLTQSWNRKFFDG